MDEKNYQKIIAELTKLNNLGILSSMLFYFKIQTDHLRGNQMPTSI